MQYGDVNKPGAPKPSQIKREFYWSKMIPMLKENGTCPRRQTSAIIIDDDNEVLATGYNGPPRRISNCTEINCPGVEDAPGDTTRCRAIHAEVNAVLQLRDRWYRAKTMICSNKPCFKCALIICQTKIKRVIYLDDYADDSGEEILREAGIEIGPLESINIIME